MIGETLSHHRIRGELWGSADSWKSRLDLSERAVEARAARTK
jgi:hypothetical protein